MEVIIIIGTVLKMNHTNTTRDNKASDNINTNHTYDTNNAIHDNIDININTITDAVDNATMYY